MKLVKGIVRTARVTDIAVALERAGVSGFTVSDVKGRGGHSRTGSYRGSPYPVLRPMSMIDIIVADGCADEVARILVDHAHTGRHGDGHVIVMAVDERYAVRTRWLDVA